MVFHFEEALSTICDTRNRDNISKAITKHKPRVIANYGAGPAGIPLEVLVEAQCDFLSHSGGVSVVEMSHRSKEYKAIHYQALEDIRQIMHIPASHQVLFMQGGASMQFAAVAMNLCPDREYVCDYVVSGEWSHKSMIEAKKYCKPHVVNKMDITSFTDHSPRTEEFSFSKNPAFFYYCGNETIQGTEYHEALAHPDSDVPVVIDMSSNCISCPIDISKYGVIFGGASKNIGPAGVTIVIVRKDLLDRANPSTPTMMHWKTLAEHDSLYNTPPVFSIYMVGLQMKWTKKMGGLKAIGEMNEKKAALIYDLIDDSSSFYTCPVTDKASRSKMNIVFRIKGGSKELENLFVEKAEAEKMIGLRGHSFVGGLRASLYNAVSIEDAILLVNYMKRFQHKYDKDVPLH